jgi:hypothetical protein
MLVESYILDATSMRRRQSAMKRCSVPWRMCELKVDDIHVHLRDSKSTSACCGLYGNTDLRMNGLSGYNDLSKE